MEDYSLNINDISELAIIQEEFAGGVSGIMQVHRDRIISSVNQVKMVAEECRASRIKIELASMDAGSELLTINNLIEAAESNLSRTNSQEDREELAKLNARRDMLTKFISWIEAKLETLQEILIYCDERLSTIDTALRRYDSVAARLDEIYNANRKEIETLRIIESKYRNIKLGI